MNYLSKLEGFQRSPAGLEWEIWKKLRLIWVTGTVLPLMASGGASLLDGLEYTRSVEQFFYVMVGLVILHWAMVLTLVLLSGDLPNLNQPALAMAGTTQQGWRRG
jgi:hypothetical protein